MLSAHNTRSLAALLALAVAADAALVFSLAGFFAGVALLVASGAVLRSCGGTTPAKAASRFGLVQALST